MSRTHIKTQTISDDAGSWELEVPNALEPGVHTVHVFVEGESEPRSTLIEITEDPVVEQRVVAQTEREEVAVPAVVAPVPLTPREILMTPVVALAFGCSLLLLIITLISALRIRTEQERLPSGKVKKKRRGTIRTIIFLVLFLLSFGWGIQSYNATKETTTRTPSATVTTPTPVAAERRVEMVTAIDGRVVDAQTSVPIAGVSLSLSGSDQVRTTADGTYAFESITGAPEGIIITHPDIKRPLQKSIEQVRNMQILFDVALINELVDVIDTEAQDNYISLVARMPFGAQSNYDGQTLSQTHNSIFTEFDRADQTLHILSVSRIDQWHSAIELDTTYDNVIEVVVADDGEGAAYYFRYTADRWQLLELPRKLL